MHRKMLRKVQLTAATIQPQTFMATHDTSGRRIPLSRLHMVEDSDKNIWLLCPRYAFANLTKDNEEATSTLEIKQSTLVMRSTES